MIGYVLQWLRRSEPWCSACNGPIKGYHERECYGGKLYHKSCVVYTMSKK